MTSTSSFRSLISKFDSRILDFQALPQHIFPTRKAFFVDLPYLNVPVDDKGPELHTIP